MSSGIPFNVDTQRVLQILTREIYDSPYAMLRENVQNAYDAIRERFTDNGQLLPGGEINICIDDNTVTIKDNGIGMSEAVLRNHFWKTGSSGKHSERARNAGVVGSFGIGAMANFGVCDAITIITKSLDTGEAFRTSASIDTLEIGKECIKLEKIDEMPEYGTTVDAKLQSSQLISENQAVSYLESYVEYLPIPVYLNGKLISNKIIASEYNDIAGYDINLGRVTKNKGRYSGIFDVRISKGGSATVVCHDLAIDGQNISGEMFLKQNGGQLMGLRSFFGLAPVPSVGMYRFGGVVNLINLHPTAGREALSRESICEINALIQLAEEAASEAIAKHRLADENTSFIQWVALHKRLDLADNITIRSLPGNKDVKLIDVKTDTSYATKHYYIGSDKTIIATFSNEDSMLLIPSTAHHKKTIQVHYLTKIGIPIVPDKPQVSKVYDSSEVELTDMKIIFRIMSILRDDYLLVDCDLKIADISHGVAVMSEIKSSKLHIYINQNSSFLTPARQFLDKAPELWSDYMKDFVRTYLYGKIQQYVPSSTKMGVDALRRQLEKSRELYAYKESEAGLIDDILGDDLEESLKGFFDGSLSFDHVLSRTRRKALPQAQRVSSANVGEIENVMQGLDVISDSFDQENQQQSPNSGGSDEVDADQALPAIDRRSLDTDKKILTTHVEYPILNSFTMFLGLSDKLMATEADFFAVPHTTRIIWSGHRVVYIFSESTSRMNLYYDIELKSPIRNQHGFGGAFKTTTLITKDRIFVPVPSELVDEFKVESGTKEFFVRHDILYGNVADENADDNE